MGRLAVVILCLGLGWRGIDSSAAELADVTQPGDPVIASSANSPGSEGVANAIDDKPTKYLNFDLADNARPAGFVVTPSIGATTVTGMSMESANDFPERDPLVVTLEGSNDDKITSFNSGHWELIVRLDNISPWGGRFETRTFTFPNPKSYRHYRWTVLATQFPNYAGFQIAEVELLTAPKATDCNQARFLVQPVDTPVLAGARATFFVTVNGPWPLQWYVNGRPIPGATSSTYTTEPVSSLNVSNVYVVQIVGCASSQTVKAVLFTPPVTRSIGINFEGFGANGTPTPMNREDIAGIFPQAYWNNAAGAAGRLPDAAAGTPGALLDNSGTPTAVTIVFAASGTWGSGTGDDLSTERMLNGLNFADPGSPGTITLANVPAGKHSVITYTVGIPLQFQEASYTIKGLTQETRYIRVINADEYNAAPGFYRGLSQDPQKPDPASYVRFDNISPAPDKTIALTWNTLTTGFDRGAPVNALQLILDAPATVDAPVITRQPQPTVAQAGGTVSLSVQVTGEQLAYQWRKNGRKLSDGGEISGTATATLMIRDFSPAAEGIYSVAVFNPGGSAVSRDASLRVSTFNIVEALASYWPLDESSGSSAANAVAGGRPALVQGTARWVKAQIGSGFSFDGQTYLFVESYPLAKKQISAAAWVNLGAGLTHDLVIIRNAQGAMTVSGGSARIVGQFELGLVCDPADRKLRPMAAVGIGPNVARVTAPAEFPAGTWHHLAFSADGAQLRLYVDGQEAAFTDYLADINLPDIAYLSVGSRLSGVNVVDSASPNFLTGQLDDLALWTRALTAEEVSKIVAVGKLGQPLTTVVEELEPSQPANVISQRIANDVVVSRLAGSGAQGFADGPAATAQFDYPNGGYTDPQGNVYVADCGNHRIRKVSPDGAVSTVAGSGVPGYLDGPAAQAMFNQPLGVCLDGLGTVFVADTGNSRIRKISPAGVVSTIAGSGLSGYVDGVGTAAWFDFPNDLAVDGAGNLFVCEFNNHTIRKIMPDGSVTTWVGNGNAGYEDGSGANARLSRPGGIAIDGLGNLYVGEWGNQRIRKISPVGQVTTLAGSGVSGYVDAPGLQAQFNNPDGLVVDPAGNLFVAENGNQVIRRITSAGVVETVAGTGVAGYADGDGSKAQFANPSGIGLDSAGMLYLIDWGNQRVRKIVVAQPPEPMHPADDNPADWTMAISEMTAYSAAWKRGSTWPTPPNPIPIGYVTRAAWLWKGGEFYTLDRSITNPPLWWINSTSPEPQTLVLGHTEAAALQSMDNESPVSSGPRAKPAKLGAAGSGTATARMAGAYLPGQPLAVIIAVTPDAGTIVYAVEDGPPRGWEAKEISTEGLFDPINQKVKWGPFFDSQPRELSYQAIPPLDVKGTVTFQGVVSVEGLGERIGGERNASLDPMPRPVLSATLQPLSAQGFRFTLQGQPGAVYQLEFSEDLKAWLPLLTVTNLDGLVECNDPNAATRRQRFYRALQPSKY